MIRTNCLGPALAFCALALFATHGTAATFIVDDPADTGAIGTLRWAFQQHVTSGTSNEIRFAASMAGQSIDLQSNLPFVSNSLTVDGSAAPGLQITGSPLGRIFGINSPATFVVRNLTLRDSDGAFGGGCIRAGTGLLVLTVDNVEFINCSQAAAGNFDALGGAIRYEGDPGGAGGLTVRDSVFLENRVSGGQNLVFGGAIYARGGQVLLERNTFERNDAVDKGSAFHQGGALFIENADVEISDNEFLFNQADEGAGGALAISLRPSNSAFVTGNLFAGNVARLGAGLWTGNQVINAGQPFFNVTHNTFLSNTSDFSSGGASFFRNGDVILRSNSWINNVNLGGGAAHLAYNPSTVSFIAIWNNLFGQAGTDSCRTTSGPAGPFPSAGYNLRPDASCEFNMTTDVVGSAGEFLPLADYGGETRTVPPGPDNLAIDAGNPQPPGSSNNALCPEFDVRGRPRPGDGNGDGDLRCDIGAYEWQAEAPLFRDGFEESGLVLP